MNSKTDLLAERYGKTAKSDGATRRRVIILATALICIFLGWAVWVTASSSAEVKAQVLGYEVLSANQTSVKFSVQSLPGPTKCAIQVLNQNYAVVGYKVVDVATSGELQTTVNTTELGVTGLVDKCWLK
jgi:hypothetical protein